MKSSYYGLAHRDCNPFRRLRCHVCGGAVVAQVLGAAGVQNLCRDCYAARPRKARAS